MVAQYGFYYNTDRCTGCKGCIAACRDKNDTFVGFKFRRVIDQAGGTWTQLDNGSWQHENVASYSISISCNHCAHPICVHNCPTHAMQKRDDGIVFVDQERCIGCGTCAMSCPYHAPRMDTDKHVMGKCDFCRDLIDKGETPMCVASCQMRAIDFGEISELRDKYGDNADIAPLPSSSLTSPSIVINASRFADIDRHITSTAEELV